MIESIKDRCPVCGETLEEVEQSLEHIFRSYTCHGITMSASEWNNIYCWKLLDEQKAEIEKLKAENNLLKDQIACAVDLANTWAREFGVMECTSPYYGLFLRDLISRLWDESMARILAELEKKEAASVGAKGEK